MRIKNGESKKYTLRAMDILGYPMDVIEVLENFEILGTLAHPTILVFECC